MTLLIGLLLLLGSLGGLAIAAFAWEQGLQRRLKQREQVIRAETQSSLSDREQALGRAELALKQQEQDLKAQEQQQSEQLQQQEQALAVRLAATADAEQKRLQTLAGLTPEQARVQVRADAQQVLGDWYEQQWQAYQAVLQAKQQALAQEQLLQVMQAQSASTVRAATTKTLILPSAQMRGRIIGKAGKNIQAFRQITGVEINLENDHLEAVLSAFDPLQLTLASRTLEQLIQEGRIFPDRIDAVFNFQQQVIEAELPQLGAAAAGKAGVGELDPKLLEMLGRLNYRLSYGQNGLDHSLEVSQLAGRLAESLGADISVARRAGLLHDLGKVLVKSQDSELTHTQAGIDLLQAAGESPEVMHAVAAHHFEVEPQTHEAVIVQIADTLSAARPGARSQVLQQQVERLQELEHLVAVIPGVESVQVLRLGQELRVIVDPDKLSEVQTGRLSFEIARRIEQEMPAAGQVKISVIREVKYTDFAH